MLKIFETVKTVVDVPALGLSAGAMGAIIDVYSEPSPAYEVEFFDSDNQVVGNISMKLDQVVAMPKVPAMKFQHRLAA